MARERRDLDANALLYSVGAEVSAPGPGGDGDVDRHAFGGNAHFLRTVEGDRAQVAFMQLVRAHHFLVGFDDRLLAVGDFHHIDVRRVVQAVDMLLQAEYGGAVDGVVGAYALEYRQPVVQRVGEHVGGSRAPGQQLAVVPDVSVAVGHRHYCQLLQCKAENAILAESGWLEQHITKESGTRCSRSARNAAPRSIPAMPKHASVVQPDRKSVV